MRSRFTLMALLAVATFAPLAHADTVRTEDPDSNKIYINQIAKGEAAYVAKDFAGSQKAFQEAVKLEPGRMLALYRLAEVFATLNKLDEAESTLQSAVNKKGSNLLKGKVMFVTALYRERAHKLPQAKEGWNAYLAFVGANSDAKGFPQIAQQHIKVIERRMKDEVDYGAVKERIKKREIEKAAEAAENAKKDTLNR